MIVKVSKQMLYYESLKFNKEVNKRYVFLVLRCIVSAIDCSNRDNCSELSLESVCIGPVLHLFINCFLWKLLAEQTVFAAVPRLVFLRRLLVFNPG